MSLAEREQVEALLIEFHDIFARHRFDVGGNDHFSVKLTPEHHDPVYTQSPPTPIHLREEILHDLAAMQYFGLITTLTYSKYSSPLFAHRKPSGKLRLLEDLRKINHLIRHDYDSNNFPITTMADAGTHLAGKSIFAKLIVARHTMHSKWLTLCQSKCWLSVLPRVRLPSNDWHKA